MPAPLRVERGRIVLHDAMGTVLRAYPERWQPGVDGYVAVDDCRRIGERLVLVRPGQPDALVAVADCARTQDVSYRRRMDYIADVGRSIWRGPEIPQDAELWSVDSRSEWMRWLERLG